MKICWMCKRTENDIIEEMGDDDIKQEEWVESMEYVGVHICPMCSDFIMFSNIKNGFATEDDLKEAMSSLSVKSSWSGDD